MQIIHRFLELLIYKNDTYVLDSRIAKSVQYLSAHYSDHISVKTAAEMVGLNHSYFGLLFKQETGVSFSHYLLQTRVRNAKKMLSSGEYSVKHIAEACRFTDTSHLNKQFKMINGFPPSHSLPKKF